MLSCRSHSGLPITVKNPAPTQVDARLDDLKGPGAQPLIEQIRSRRCRTFHRGACIMRSGRGSREMSMAFMRPLR